MNYRIRVRQTEDQQHQIADRARRQFQQRRTDRNRQAHALLRAGRDCHNRGEYANAIHHFNGAVSLEPNDATIYNDRGVAHRAIGEYDLAISDYSSTVRLNPNYGLAYSNRGNVYARKGEYELAILDYGRAIKLKDDCHSVYNNRGLAHAKKVTMIRRSWTSIEQSVSLQPSLKPTTTGHSLMHAKGYTIVRSLTMTPLSVLIRYRH